MLLYMIQQLGFDIEHRLSFNVWYCVEYLEFLASFYVFVMHKQKCPN